eukprot:TRINITY_DN8194_c0_g5_i3.p1 TRINITY_DN8194_c0_g5~~TRINITY_DN8194_c0_g5_i3.p1  ORF type:complete len:1441 (+),score=381.01 TRINITY_DN8194_c0_g5_i3:40-4323(+)
MKNAVAVLLFAAVGDALTACGQNGDCQCTNGDCQFICDTKAECKGSHLSCSGTSCHVDCTGANACQAGHLMCTASNTCQYRCASTDSCRSLVALNTQCTQWELTTLGKVSGTTVSWCESSCYNSAGQLSVACDVNAGPAQHCVCKQTIQASAPYGMYCSSDAKGCKTICDGSHSCDQSSMYCASDKCELLCNGKNSCQETVYECTSNDCEITCNENSSCKNMRLKCPTGSNKTCLLKCIGAQSCSGMNSSMFSGSVTVQCSSNDACHPDLLALVTPAPSLSPIPPNCRSFIPRDTAQDGVKQEFCDAACFSNDQDAISQCNTNCVCNDCYNWVPTLPGGVITDLWCNLMCNNRNDAAFHLCKTLCECKNQVTSAPTNAPAPVKCTNGAVCQCSGSGKCEILCDGLLECQHANLHCGSGDCDVLCSGMESCASGSIDCSSGTDCRVDCSGYLSCRNLSPIPLILHEQEAEALAVAVQANQISGVSSPAIHCGSSAERCDIDCNGMLACQDTAVKCESTKDCDLTCSQTMSCKGLKEECKGGDCIGKCTGYKSCQDAVFAWGSGGDALLECTHTLSCAGADIECPKGKDCIVHCSGWESCLGMKLRCPPKSSGQKCEIHCTYGRACAGMHKDTQVTGYVTTVECNGWGACESDLQNYANAPPTSSPACSYWVPTDAGAWTGFTHTYCDLMCDTSGILKDICTAANNVVQLCECGSPSSTNSPKPADNTCQKWGLSSSLSVVPGAMIPSVPANWCDSMCTNSATSAICTSAYSICECQQQLPAYTTCNKNSCQCTEKDCRIKCDAYRGCMSLSKSCPSTSTSCDLTCSGLESCKNGYTTCSSTICHVTCSGYASCKGISYSTGTALSCNSPQMCQTTCSGVDSCRSVGAKCTSTNNCNVECSGATACYGMVHTCTGGAGKSGTVTCSGYKSCYGAHFKWSQCGATTVKCTDTSSCQGATFDCPEGHSCLIECDGETSCQDVTLNCPVNLPAGTLCEIKCTGLRSCLGIDKTKVSGSVTASCTGYDACTSDLSGAVPNTCVEYETIQANSTLDCNTLCTNPATDVVCEDPAPAGVIQLCRCKIQPTPEPACVKWDPTAYGQSTGTSSATCTQWCSNPLTSSVCSYDGNNMNNKVCGVWELTARGTQQPGLSSAWCQANCYAPGTTVLSAACNPASGVDQHCQCADKAITPLCQCEVPTPAPTLAPSAPARHPVMRKVFRTFMRRLKRWFNRERFVSALLGLLVGWVRGCTVHWVCPASACDPICPITEAQKIAKGCTSGILVLERMAEVMASVEDSSYVEYGFDYDQGANETVVEEKLGAAIDNAKTDNTSVLAEFGMQNITTAETEVMVDKNDSDDFPKWAIAVIVICVVFCLVITAFIIFKATSSSSSSASEETQKEDPAAEANHSNEPVEEPAPTKKKAPTDQRPPWK